MLQRRTTSFNRGGRGGYGAIVSRDADLMTHRQDMAEQSLVQPVVSPNTPRLGPLAVIAGVAPDVRMIAEMTVGAEAKGKGLYQGRIFSGIGSGNSTLAGPVLGAPQAVMVLENLLAWGARSVLFFGWCGAVDPACAIGDVLCISEAFCDEGTSPHYGAAPRQPVPVSAISPLPRSISDGMAHAEVPVRTAAVWTTDAIFRETPSQVAAFRSRGAAAVDMETSALMSAAAYHGTALCCVLVVSDALHESGWVKGFTDPVFRTNRRLLCQLIAEYLATAADKL